MKLRLSWGPSAFAVSMLALFLSLGGTSYALTAVSGLPATSHTQLHAAHAAPSTKLPAWRNLTLTGAWKYGGSGSYHAAFYKDSQSVVHLRGSAFGGSDFTVVFRLPRGDRPGRTLWLPVYAFDGSAGGLEIEPNGNASLFDTNNGNNVMGFASFDGISFRVP